MIHGSDFNRLLKCILITDCNKWKEGQILSFKDDVVIMTADEYNKLRKLFEHEKLLTYEDSVKAKEMHLNGLSYKKIGDIFKVSGQTIFRACKLIN